MLKNEYFSRNELQKKRVSIYFVEVEGKIDSFT